MRHNYVSKKLVDLDLSDKKVFEHIFKTFHWHLCLFANQYLNDMVMAEELVQETFLKLWEKRDELNIQVSLKSYLFKSVLNGVYNFYKHKKVEQKYQEWYKSHIKQEELANTGLKEGVDVSKDVSEAIDKLPERCKEVFVMSRFQGLRHKEIAEKLDIKPKTVEAQIRKANLLLRDLLKKYSPVIIWLLLKIK